VIAYPGAWIMRTFGAKSSILASAVISALGTFIGLFASTPELILLSRVHEGAAFGIAAVIIPSVISSLFPQEKMGLVMGIWSLWTCPGMLLAFLTVSPMVEAFGPRSLWVTALALELICTLWVAKSCRIPAEEPPAVLASNDSVRPRGYIKSAIVVAFSFICWTMLFGPVSIYYPSFMQHAYGVSPFASSMIPLLMTMVTMPCGIAFGVIAGKTVTRKWFLVGAYAVAVILYATIGFNPDAPLWAAVVMAAMFGVCAGAVPMATYGLVPILAAEPKRVGYCMATLTLALQLGNIIAGFMTASIAQVGYHETALCIALPFGVVGLVVNLLAVGDRRALANQGEK
jgi:cyanate permease